MKPSIGMAMFGRVPSSTYERSVARLETPEVSAAKARQQPVLIKFRLNRCAESYDEILKAN